MELPRIEDRVSFFYVEKAKISRKDGFLEAVFETTAIHIPTAQVACLLLGPLTTITHDAMSICSNFGTGVYWVTSGGDILIASAPSLTTNPTLMERQAFLFSNQKRRVEVARKLYTRRFPEDDVKLATHHQLLGMEGQHMKTLYRSLAEEYGVPWNSRVPRKSLEPVNKLITIGNHVLYSMSRLCVNALGMSPALGFLHRGHSQSFVMDVADLYKPLTSIPVAFQVVAEAPPPQYEVEVYRKRLRQSFHEHRLLKMIPRDIGRVMDEECNESIKHLEQPRITAIEGKVWKI